MANVVIDDQNLKDIANSIRYKAGTQDTYLPEEMPAAIDNIPTGIAEVEIKDITFVDYDGTIIKSYTFEEVQALDTLPDLPTRDNPNIINSGWNWTLEELKTVNFQMVVGNTVKPKDDYIMVKIHFPANSSIMINAMNPLNISDTYEVDWGDGTIEQWTGWGSPEHLYADNLEEHWVRYKNTNVNTTWYLAPWESGELPPEIDSNYSVKGNVINTSINGKITGKIWRSNVRQVIIPERAKKYIATPGTSRQTFNIDNTFMDGQYKQGVYALPIQCHLSSDVDYNTQTIRQYNVNTYYGCDILPRWNEATEEKPYIIANSSSDITSIPGPISHWKFNGIPYAQGNPIFSYPRYMKLQNRAGDTYFSNISLPTMQGDESLEQIYVDATNYNFKNTLSQIGGGIKKMYLKAPSLLYAAQYCFNDTRDIEEVHLIGITSVPRSGEINYDEQFEHRDFLLNDFPKLRQFKLYVPNNLVNQFKSHPDWQGLKDYIYGE